MAVNKRAGKKSLAQNDFLFPAEPLIGTATDVGTNRAFNNGAATVTFTAQGPNAATSFTVTSSPGGFTATGASSPLTVVGLQSATDYSFVVTASNAGGTSPSSASSNTILATTVPATPAAPAVASPNANQDVITITAPANGGKAISGYIWASNDGKTNLAGGSPGNGPEAGPTITINQEAGTAQTYTVYAINANGVSQTSAASASITTTFSFAPFGAFGFSPFGAFGFSPFGAFGFSPFGFSPFGFSPFGAFGFSPYGGPRCIAGGTEIATVGEDDSVVWVKAKDIKAGDKVFSPLWDEFDGTPSPYDSRIEYESMTNMRIGIGEIEYILEKSVDNSVMFNNDGSKHFSLTQPILARKHGKLDAWEFTGDLVPGDIIWEYNFETKEYFETEITDINVITTENDVFQIGVKDIDTFIAAGIVSHNK